MIFFKRRAEVGTGEFGETGWPGPRRALRSNPRHTGSFLYVVSSRGRDTAESAQSARASARWRRRGEAGGAQTGEGSREGTNFGANCSVTAAQVCALESRSLGAGDRARGQPDGWKETLTPSASRPILVSILCLVLQRDQPGQRRPGSPAPHLLSHPPAPVLRGAPGTWTWLNSPR